MTLPPRTTRRRKAKADPITPETRAEVKRRSRGWCEAQPGCVSRADHLHHRQLRRHGDHSASNLMHVCFFHHDWIHSHITESYERGWLVHSWDEVRPL